MVSLTEKQQKELKRVAELEIHIETFLIIADGIMEAYEHRNWKNIATYATQLSVNTTRLRRLALDDKHGVIEIKE